MTGWDVPYPPASLEQHYLPSVERIADADAPDGGVLMARARVRDAGPRRRVGGGRDRRVAGRRGRRRRPEPAARRGGDREGDRRDPLAVRRGGSPTLHGAVGDAIAVGAPLVTFTVAGDERRRRRPTAEPAAPVGATPAVRKLAKELGVDLARFRHRAGGPGHGRGRSGGGRERRSEPTGSDTDRAVTARQAHDRARPVTRSGRRSPRSRRSGRSTAPRSSVPARARGLSLAGVRAALVRIVAGHPLLNASWTDDAIRCPNASTSGSPPTPTRGLVVPVVRDAQADGHHGAIASEIRRLGEAARGGHLAPRRGDGCHDRA